MNRRFIFSGSSCAGAVAAGIACFFLGFVMMLGVDKANTVMINEGFSKYSTPAISLTILIWLLGWFYLHVSWKNKQVRRKDAYKTATVLVLLGISGSFYSIIKLALS